jgi:hypothetical protein
VIRIVSARRLRELEIAEARYGAMLSRIAAARSWFHEWPALEVVWKFLRDGGEKGDAVGDVRAAADSFRRRLGSKGL